MTLGIREYGQYDVRLTYSAPRIEMHFEDFKQVVPDHWDLGMLRVFGLLNW